MLVRFLPQIHAIAGDRGFRLRVATAFSGTEAPIHALKIMMEAGPTIPGGKRFIEYEHLFSVENEPFKQAYIARNAPGSIVFRDMVDFVTPDVKSAPTIYGHHSDIPTGIDLLIAGPSCVDFSTLNSKKTDAMQLSKGKPLLESWSKAGKRFPEGLLDKGREWLEGLTAADLRPDGKSTGESTVTFMAMLYYISKHRPKMVVLENVVGAPFDAICNFFLPIAGYMATFRSADTKEYYIPQTRQRGYVVALLENTFGASEKKVLHDWEEGFVALRRGASAPVHDWLLSPHHPLTMRARQDESEKAITSGLNSSRENTWDRSRVRHSRYRRQFGLGNGRPLTAWGLGGTEQPYDRLDRLVIGTQNPRALDRVDIHHLFCRRTQPNTLGPMQFDTRFKAQIIDLSQNVDRSPTTRNFGITGCLTPRGQNLITHQGRLVTGAEALKLQGLYLLDLILTIESQDELRDLAGNAMTTTVVGAAIFSLLIATHKHYGERIATLFQTKIRPNNTVVVYRPLYQPPIDKDTSRMVWSIEPPQENMMGRVLDLLPRCRRHCYCNGGAKYSTTDIVRCRVCLTTRCTSCKGNPKHQFGPSFPINNPIMNDATPEEMMRCFPTALTRIISKKIDHIRFRTDTHNDAPETELISSLRSAIFYYTEVHITENVTICYSAGDKSCFFRLQAVVSDRCVTWYLFLDPWSECGKRLSKALSIPASRMSRPIGRVRIPSDSHVVVPRRDAWEFWVFSESVFDVTFANPTSQSIEITKVCLQSIPSSMHSDIKSIVGTYRHHPECDAAEESLHAHVRNTEETKQFLFKDPTRTGPTEEDCYIISDECRFLEGHEFRDFRVSFEPRWTPQSMNETEKASISGYWKRALDGAGDTQSITSDAFPRYAAQTGRHSIPAYSDLPRNGDGHRIRTLASTSLDSNMVAKKFWRLLKYAEVDSDDWAILLRSDYSVLFALMTPVIVNLRGTELNIHLAAVPHCESCCPALPKIHWMERSLEGVRGNVREPYRISHQMRAYEKRLRQFSDPVQIAINIKRSGKGSDWMRVTANFEINIDMLAHQAASHLPKRDDNSEHFCVRSSVEVEKVSSHIVNLLFKSFLTSLRPSPRTHDQGKDEFHGVFTDGYDLTPPQKVALKWMLNMEHRPTLFTEREAEEYRFDHIRMRVVGFAERHVLIRGGILADATGFGKTILIIAIVILCWCHAETWSQLPHNEDTLRSPATVVLCPPHLVSQWVLEVLKFTGWKEGLGNEVIQINSSRDLQGCVSQAEPGHHNKRARTTDTTMLASLRHAFLDARFIIVSTAVFDNTYYTWLGKYAGSLAHPKIIPKTTNTTNTANIHGAFKDWYEDAVFHARKHVAGFQPPALDRNLVNTVGQRVESLQKTWKEVVEDYYDTSRLNQQSPSGGKTEIPEYSGTARANILTADDLQSDKLLFILEACNYARMVYDEFSYENPSASLFFKHAKATAKWVLSATPPSENLKAVCGIADLLGIHIARPLKLRPGLPRITEGPRVLSQSRMEKQLSYSRLYTDKAVQDRMEQAHKFLRHYASANPFDNKGLGNSQVIERAYCSYMSRYASAKYIAVQRDLRQADSDISSILKRHNLVSEDLNKDKASENKIRAGLALAYLASVKHTKYNSAKMVCNDVDHDLKASKANLKTIMGVTVWLVLRRYEEDVAKKNESATNAIEDLAYELECILERNAEACGGAEALEQITTSLFDKGFENEGFKACAQWLAGRNARTGYSYCKELFRLIEMHTEPATWATYFSLEKSQIPSLQRQEVFAFMTQFDGQVDESLTEDQARDHLKTSKKLAERGDPRPKYPRFHTPKRTRGANYTEIESELLDIALKWTEAKEEVMVRVKQNRTAQNLFPDNPHDPKHKCDACERNCEDMRFLPDCGHFICAEHLNDPNIQFCGQIKSEKYPDGSHCPALMHLRSIPVKQIDRCAIKTVPESAPVLGPIHPSCSFKSWSIVEKINKILQSSEDKMVVFYQLQDQWKEIKELLHYYGVGYLFLGDEGEEQGPDADRVRVIRISSEAAAGSNYQDANHVFFTSTPVFGKQEDYDKYMKQAKGRVIRHGQQKNVYIYYWVSANTFEVDLLQLRTRSRIQLAAPGVGHGDLAIGLFTPYGDEVELGEDAHGSLTSGLSDGETWRLTDETNWLVQQNREF